MYMLHVVHAHADAVKPYEPTRNQLACAFRAGITQFFSHAHKRDCIIETAVFGLAGEPVAWLTARFGLGAWLGAGLGAWLSPRFVPWLGVGLVTTYLQARS